MIVVTAPTGQIGRQVVEQLLSADASIRVIARDPSRLSPKWRDQVEVMEGSHGDGDVVDRAFVGARAVFWLVPPNPRAASVHEAYVDFTEPAAKAFKAHGVERVVGITALGRGSPLAERAGFVTGSLAMDELIASAGVGYRGVASPSFFDNLLRQVAPIRDRGMFFSAVDPDRKLPACATRDIAASAARLLLDDKWSGVGHVAVLGPEDLSFNDMAGIMSDVLGQPVRCQRTDYATYKAEFVGMGLSDAMAEGMADMARAKSEGLDNAEPRTPETTTPTGFRQWCEDELKPRLSKGE